MKAKKLIYLIVMLTTISILMLEYGCEKKTNEDEPEKINEDEQEKFLWIATRSTGVIYPFYDTTGGLAYFDGKDDWTVYIPSNSGIPTKSLSTLATNGTDLWIGIDYIGLVKFDGSDWIHYDESYLGSPFVRTIAIDNVGNIWVGTVFGGLAKFDGTNWATYDYSNGNLPSDNISALLYEDDNLWIGMDIDWPNGEEFRGGLARFDGTNFTIYDTLDSEFPNGIRIFSLAIDKSKNIWIGTYDEGIIKFNESTWTVYNTSNSDLPDNYVGAIAVDNSENIWIGTCNNGLVKFDGSNWMVYNKPYERIDCIVIDSLNNKWIGTSEGLFKFDDNNWTEYNTSNSDLPGPQVPSLAIMSAN